MQLHVDLRVNHLPTSNIAVLPLPGHVIEMYQAYPRRSLHGYAWERGYTNGCLIMAQDDSRDWSQTFVGSRCTSLLRHSIDTKTGLFNGTISTVLSITTNRVTVQFNHHTGTSDKRAKTKNWSNPRYFPSKAKGHLQRGLKGRRLKGCQRGQHQQTLILHSPQRSTTLSLWMGGHPSKNHTWKLPSTFKR